MKLFLQTSTGTELVLRCIEFDTYRIAISSNCGEFDTRFNVNKYITVHTISMVLNEITGENSNASGGG